MITQTRHSGPYSLHFEDQQSKHLDSESVQAPRTPFTGYGLKIGGGRTRIRTRVFGLEGQSDIQLHYTSLF